MLKSWKTEIPKEYQKAFYQNISLDSALRVRTVLVVLALMQTVQLFLYLSSTGSSLNDRDLILLKIIIIMMSVVSYFFLTLLKKREARKAAEPVLVAIVALILIWSVVNTFKAQSITSDISVYVMVLYAVSAVVRFRPWISALVYSMVYIFFVIGIPFYQPIPDYKTSHIMNGLILNIIALLIAHMMYRYSLTDFMDKQKIKVKHSELLHLAKHDGLTTLYNHQAIHEQLELAIYHARSSSEALSVMLIDLDHFKELNDHHGHKMGDSALKKVSEIIMNNVRQNDMAGRYGGDEFMVILPGSNAYDTKEIAFRLLNEIRHLNLGGMKLSFSCGIAEWNGETADQLVEKADKVLYRVKNDGRNNVYA